MRHFGRLRRWSFIALCTHSGAKLAPCTLYKELRISLFHGPICAPGTFQYGKGIEPGKSLNGMRRAWNAGTIRQPNAKDHKVNTPIDPGRMRSAPEPFSRPSAGGRDPFRGEGGRGRVTNAAYFQCSCPPLATRVAGSQPSSPIRELPRATDWPDSKTSPTTESATFRHQATLPVSWTAGEKIQLQIRPRK